MKYFIMKSKSWELTCLCRLDTFCHLTGTYCNIMCDTASSVVYITLLLKGKSCTLENFLNFRCTMQIKRCCLCVNWRELLLQVLKPLDVKTKFHDVNVCSARYAVAPRLLSIIILLLQLLRRYFTRI